MWKEAQSHLLTVSGKPERWRKARALTWPGFTKALGLSYMPLRLALLTWSTALSFKAGDGFHFLGVLLPRLDATSFPSPDILPFQPLRNNLGNQNLECLFRSTCLSLENVF